MTPEGAVATIVNEHNREVNQHPRMKSYPEGYAVLLEAVDELGVEVKQQKPDILKLRKEASHVGAMALRFLIELT